MASVFNVYVNDAGAFVQMLPESVLRNDGRTTTSPGRQKDEIDSGTLRLNRSYQALIDQMKAQINNLEAANESAR